MLSIGFDNEKYLLEQSNAILERAANFDNKLYIEFGGKLASDYHAARVLPGFDPNVKLRLLQVLKDKIDIVICVYADDIERRKMRADFGIAYDAETLRTMDNLRDLGLHVRAVVITRFADQPAVIAFMNKLTRRKIKVYTHRNIPGYPADLDAIVSEKGFGSNEYIESDKPIVIVTGPGPSSGKMATCLSQVYHEQRRGVRAGYAKFETFPVWNLPLQHPVNVAYEAATADLADVNMVDSFHLEAYGVVAVSYNRDIDAFPVARRALARMIPPDQLYKSPTDMGVNRVGFAITDDAAVRYAAGQELIRRYFRYRCDYELGIGTEGPVVRTKGFMDNAGLSEIDRNVVAPAQQAALAAAKKSPSLEVHCGAALELPDGTIVTGKNSSMMHAAAACVLNAIKHLAGQTENLLAADVIASVVQLRKEVLKSRRVSLDLGEALIALSVSLPSNPAVRQAMKQLKHLAGCEMHLTHLPAPGDEAGLRKLGVNLTCDPNFASRDLFSD